AALVDLNRERVGCRRREMERAKGEAWGGDQNLQIVGRRRYREMEPSEVVGRRFGRGGCERSLRKDEEVRAGDRTGQRADDTVDRHLLVKDQMDLGMRVGRS